MQVPKGRLATAMLVASFLGALGLQCSSLESLVASFSHTHSDWMSWVTAGVVVFASAALTAIAVVNSHRGNARVIILLIAALSVIETFHNMTMAGTALLDTMPATWSMFWWDMDERSMWRVAAFAHAGFIPMLSLALTYLVAEAARPYLADETGEATARGQFEPISRIRRSA